MKKFLKWLLNAGFLLLITSVAVGADAPTVTIYNSNLGLVQETRDIAVKKGRQVVELTDVAAAIQPATVHMSAAVEGLELFEQNFQYDLVNANKVFDKYVGNTITVVTKDDEPISGKLLSRDRGLLMLQNDDGSLRFISSSAIQEFEFPKLPQGLILRPTLQWVVRSERAGTIPVELSYLTGGMSWEAEYILLLHEDDESGLLSSWVTLENSAGATFENATIKLVAGDIGRARDQRRGGPKMQAEMMALHVEPGVSERGIFEYHLYEINFPTTLYQRAIKQVTFRDPTTIGYGREYTFEHTGRQTTEQQSVDVQIVFRNSEENNLGIALPAGVVRLMQEDTDGKEILVGEDRLGHTPKDEEIRLTAGRAFDIVGERKILEQDRRSDHSERITVGLSLRNHKDKSIEVKVLEHFRGDWQVYKSTHDQTRIDAGTIQYVVEIPADGETEIQYTVERRW